VENWGRGKGTIAGRKNHFRGTLVATKKGLVSEVFMDQSIRKKTGRKKLQSGELKKVTRRPNNFSAILGVPRK